MPVVGVGVGVSFPVHRRAGAPSFTGAYDDIPNIAALYGFRRGKTSYESNLIRLRRSSDNDELDIGYVDNGDLDMDAAATFIGAGSGFITTWYDQSGNGFNATQATAARQPLYVAAGQNGKPVARFDGTDDYLGRTSFLSNYPWETMVVANGVASEVYGSIVSDSSSSTNSVYQVLSITPVGHTSVISRNTTTFESAVTGTAGVAAIHAGRWPSATSRIARRNGVDGTPQTTSVSFPATDTFYIGRLRPQDLSAMFNGDIAELVIANDVWSTADREAAEAAANSYWSVF